MEDYKEADTLFRIKSKRPDEIYFGECPPEIVEYIYALEEALGIEIEDINHPFIGFQYQVHGYSNGKKIKTIAVYDGLGYASDSHYIPKQYAKNIKPVHAGQIKS